MSQTQTAIELTTNPPGPRHDEQQRPVEELEQNNYTLSKGPTAAIFLSVSGITGISSLLAGVVTVTLPSMVESLSIPPSLLLW